MQEYLHSGNHVINTLCERDFDGLGNYQKEGVIKVILVTGDRGYVLTLRG